MANFAFLSLWFHDFTIQKGTHHLEALLTLFPLSTARRDFRLLIRSLDTTQQPTLERDLLATPSAVRELAEQFLHQDTSYEVTAHWDLWHAHTTAGPSLEWNQTPSRVELLLQGEQFDQGRYRETGHVLLSLGFEHLYTGHADILSGAEVRPEDFTNRAEHEFIFALQEPQALEAYRRHTCENIRRLYSYLRQMEESLPTKERRLWSEGETDFARRTEQILAAS